MQKIVELSGGGKDRYQNPKSKIIGDDIFRCE